jgi:hypothetical protein
MTLARSPLTDDHVLADALGTFLRHASCGDVTVQCRGGVVSLRGIVPSHTARTAAEDLVLAHDGVRSVQNHLVVDPALRASSGQASEEIENRR